MIGHMSYNKDMRPERWMEDLFSSRARIRILRLLATDPSKAWTEREVAAAIQMSPNSVNLALREIARTQILSSRRMGRSHVVKLKDDLQLAKTLQSIFRLEERTWDDLERAIRGAVPRGAACYLFGSTARGEAGPDSDIDLLVAAATQDEADEAAFRVRQAAGRVFPAQLSILAVDRKWLRTRRRHPLLQAILAEGRPLSRATLETLR